MSDKKPENSSAFPNENSYEKGLTKRDYFAAVALQGLLANPDLQKSFRRKSTDGFNIHNFNAIVAYQAADEMLKARES